MTTQNSTSINLLYDYIDNHTILKINEKFESIKKEFSTTIQECLVFDKFSIEDLAELSGISEKKIENILLCNEDPSIKDLSLLFTELNKLTNISFISDIDQKVIGFTGVNNKNDGGLLNDWMSSDHKFKVGMDYEDIKIQISELIEYCLNEKEYSIKDLSKLSGISKKKIKKILECESNIKLSLLAKILYSLEKSISVNYV